MNSLAQAQLVEQEILTHHAALKTQPMQGAAPSFSAHPSNLEHFKNTTGIQLLDLVPEEFISIFEGARKACAKLEFVELDSLILAGAWVRQTMRLGQFVASQWPTQRVDFGLKSHAGNSAFTPCPQKLGLYAVLANAAFVSRMARVGVPTLQLRFKSDDEYLIEKEIERCVQTCTGLASNLFINDHWRLAIKHGAYGVHLGQEDVHALSREDWAQIKASGLRLGISTHGYSEMIRADALQPSYIAMGAVFPTTLKKMQTPPQGLARLKQYASLLRDYPLVAIGGITERDFASVLETGVGSIAVVREIVQDTNPEEKARLLCRLLNTETTEITEITENTKP